MTYSTTQISKELGVKVHTVLAWIHAGELAAINVAKTLSTRPRYRVSEESYQSFLQRRAAASSPRPKAPPAKCPGYAPGHEMLI